MYLLECPRIPVLGDSVNRGNALLELVPDFLKNRTYASCARLPTYVMVKVLVLAGGTRQSRPSVKEETH